MTETIQKRPRFRSVALRNFRGFKALHDAQLAPLTFLVGPNSSGKSSLSDALMLLAQSGMAPLGTLHPRWQGDLVDLGSYEDTVFAHRSTLDLRISYEADVLVDRYSGDERLTHYRVDHTIRNTPDDPRGTLKLVTVTDLEQSSVLELKYVQSVELSIKATRADGNSIASSVPMSVLEEAPYNMQSALYRVLRSELATRRRRRPSEIHERLLQLFEPTALSWFIRDIERVSSGRGGPDRWYSLGRTARQASQLVGGPALFDTIDPSMVTPIRGRRPSTSRRKDARFESALSRVLRELNIADSISNDQISPYHSVIRVRDNVTGVRSNLMEVGYGASQVLPVIRASLSDSISPLFVEQPEIHLHPKAQSAIAQLLCETSLRRQVIVETHSVHMINRARIMLAKGDLPPGHVTVNYVDRTRSGSRLHQIPIKDNGDFAEEWPHGFFDERYADTMELLSLKQQH